MNQIEKILLTEEFVKANQQGYDSGHDWWHIVRVRKLAQFINEAEKLADSFTVDITALLHDTADSKFAGSDGSQGYQMISDFLEKNEMSDIKDQVLKAIRKVSFSSKDKSKIPDDHILFVIQDADRLDAIGAIGIARAFNYGGFRNNKIYDPAPYAGKNSSTINHFYEKLLLLTQSMNTSTGRKLAEERHEFLMIFLDQFYKEWEFATVITS